MKQYIVVLFVFVAFCSVSQAEVSRNLTRTQVESLMPEAIQRWVDAGENREHLQMITFEIKKMDNMLGYAPHPHSLNIFYLNVSACGSEWYIDPTPHTDNEFEIVGQKQIAHKGEASKRMDLLSVIIHEMGHVLYYEHNTNTCMRPKIPLSCRTTKIRYDKRKND